MNTCYAHFDFEDTDINFQLNSLPLLSLLSILTAYIKPKPFAYFVSYGLSDGKPLSFTYEGGKSFIVEHILCHFENIGYCINYHSTFCLHSLYSRYSQPTSSPSHSPSVSPTEYPTASPSHSPTKEVSTFV